jgi:choline dehydrogenase-like flavoprotein
MIANANEVEQGAVLRTRCCIVGGGAAGIAMALALEEAGVDSVLLEGGQFSADAATQDLYAGDVTDENLHSPPVHYRVRQFGGSTTIWGGRCVPFDRQDFLGRPAVPDSGWPIDYSEVARHYPTACELLEAGAAEFSARRTFQDVAPALFPALEAEGVSTDGMERFSCPTNVGDRYRARLQVARFVSVLLGANCTNLKVSSTGTSVESVEVRTLSGRSFQVVADAVVLAVGGLEVPRLLLASNDVLPNGIGNERDVVGRYYMCHLAGSVGTLEAFGPPEQVPHGYLMSPDGVYCRRRLSLTAERQRSLGVPNVVARLHFPTIGDPRHGNSVLSAIFLLRRFISYEYSRRVATRAEGGLMASLRHLANVVRYPHDAIAFGLHWTVARKLADRKFPSVILRNRSNRFSLEINAEQSPIRDSRVTLTNRRDALGMQRICVDWRYDRRDIDGVVRTLMAFADAFQRSGAGRYVFDPERVEEDLTCYGAYGGHHIGTARMGVDPRSSVVDPNCRVHGVRNLYIASSAVFPTSSQANPTLHLVALTLRLAAHLSSALHRGEMK